MSTKCLLKVRTIFHNADNCCVLKPRANQGSIHTPTEDAIAATALGLVFEVVGVTSLYECEKVVNDRPEIELPYLINDFVPEKNWPASLNQ